MALSAELEDALRDWENLKGEYDRAQMRLAAAQASLDELAQLLVTAGRRVSVHAGVGRAVTESFFRVGTTLFQVTYTGLDDLNIRLITPDE